MCHQSPPLDLDQLRSILSLADQVRRIGAEPSVGLHPEATARAVHAFLANPPATADAAGVRERLFDLKQSPDGEVFFISGQESEDKAWTLGNRKLSKEKLMKMPPAQRLGILKDDKGARL